jgi:bifunctional non-homologous end joining protein LigD
MGLAEYKRKRDFKSTPEPSSAKAPRKHKQPIFVVQEHHASTHHFDFRLEADGVLKSWAVPKGPSMSPADKRLAVEVEDHPLSYATFSGDIPEGHYGAGHVEIWDHGTYEPESPISPKTVPDALEKGRLTFELHGRKLKGAFSLIRTRPRGGKPQWLLMKRTDEHADVSDRPFVKPKGAVRRVNAVPKVVVSKAKSKGVELTHPEKVLYPEVPLTKQDVADYYRRVAHVMLPYLRNRPVTVERFPAGVAEKSPRFWQKNLPKGTPDWVARVELPSEEGKRVQYGLINDLDTLMWFVNQNAVSYHVYLSTVDDLERPDVLLFDLDPGGAAFTDVVRVAKSLHEILEGHGVASYLKTSGKSGLHVLTRWEEAGGYDAARAWAESVAGELVGRHPTLATTERTIAKRGGRIYVDYVQNALGHHFVAPYSLRAMGGATVSTPLEWGELTGRLNPKAFTAKGLPKRVAGKGDLMAGVLGGDKQT